MTADSERRTTDPRIVGVLPAEVQFMLIEVGRAKGLPRLDRMDSLNLKRLVLRGRRAHGDQLRAFAVDRRPETNCAAAEDSEMVFL